MLLFYLCSYIAAFYLPLPIFCRSVQTYIHPQLARLIFGQCSDHCHQKVYIPVTSPSFFFTLLCFIFPTDPFDPIFNYFSKKRQLYAVILLIHSLSIFFTSALNASTSS